MFACTALCCCVPRHPQAILVLKSALPWRVQTHTGVTVRFLNKDSPCTSLGRTHAPPPGRDTAWRCSAGQAAAHGSWQLRQSSQCAGRRASVASAQFSCSPARAQFSPCCRTCMCSQQSGCRTWRGCSHKTSRRSLRPRRRGSRPCRLPGTRTGHTEATSAQGDGIARRAAYYLHCLASSRAGNPEHKGS